MFCTFSHVYRAFYTFSVVYSAIEMLRYILQVGVLR